MDQLSVHYPLQSIAPLVCLIFQFAGIKSEEDHGSSSSVSLHCYCRDGEVVAATNHVLSTEYAGRGDLEPTCPFAPLTKISTCSFPLTSLLCLQ